MARRKMTAEEQEAAKIKFIAISYDIEKELKAQQESLAKKTAEIKKYIMESNDPALIRKWM